MEKSVTEGELYWLERGSAEFPPKQFTRGSSEAVQWSLKHPENWTPDTVQEWIRFVSEKFGFHESIRVAVMRALRGISGTNLLQMSLPEFRRDFEDVGELIYTAFQQILDVAPNFEDRADIYSTKIVQLMHDLEKTQGQKANVLSWKRLHPEYWSCVEVYDWLQCCAEQYNIESPDCELLFGRLSKLTGKDLCAISTEEFRTLSPMYGEILFMSIKLFKEKGESKRKRHRSSGELPSVPEEGNSA